MDRTITTHRCHFFSPEFTFKICFFATNYGILHFIKTCTSQNFKPCFVHSFSLFVQTTKQTLNSWNAQEILPGPHFFPVILLTTPARHPVQVHWRQQGLYHPIRLSRRGHIYAWPEPWTKAGWRMHRATWGGRRSERMHTATRGPGRRKTTMPSAPPRASIQEVRQAFSPILLNILCSVWNSKHPCKGGVPIIKMEI